MYFRADSGRTLFYSYAYSGWTYKNPYRMECMSGRTLANPYERVRQNKNKNEGPPANLLASPPIISCVLSDLVDLQDLVKIDRPYFGFF